MQILLEFAKQAQRLGLPHGTNLLWCCMAVLSIQAVLVGGSVEGHPQACSRSRHRPVWATQGVSKTNTQGP